MSVKIRRALMSDCDAIYKLLQRWNRDNKLLARSYSAIYESLRDFFVAVKDDRVVGTAAMHFVWHNLGELRSVAVEESEHGAKIGHRLVEACIDDAIFSGLQEVFVLTLIPDYFKSFGFELINPDELPRAIWADCINCPLYPDCNETPLIYRLS
jgi:amino-acid N-acetyltransferase